MNIIGVVSPQSMSKEDNLMEITPTFKCNIPLDKGPYQSSQRRYDDLNGKGVVVKYLPDSQELIIARDIVGISPLYYYHSEDYFVFSDALSLILKYIPSKSLNKKALSDFLFYSKMERSADTLISEVKELPPAGFIKLELSTGAVENYKSGASFCVASPIEYEDLVEKNREKVSQYISSQIEASHHDRHALLLSGGLDSSVLATIMTKQLKPANLSLYTLRNESSIYDETSFAQLISDQYTSYNWKKITPSSSQFVQDVELMHDLIEWPTMSTGTYNQYLLLKECAAQGEEVIWDGLGADALYGGHDHYKYDFVRDLLKKMKIAAAAEALSWKGSLTTESKELIKYAIRRSILNSKQAHKFFLKWKREFQLYNRSFLTETFSLQIEAEEKDLRLKMKNDFFEGGVRHLSRFTDRISKHFGLEMKYPFAENVEWGRELSSLPRELIFHQGIPKSVLRDSFKSDLPAAIYNRKDKKGLPSPNNEWIADHKKHWKGYFTNDLSEYYDIDYIHDHYEQWWDISDRRENYRHFKHISFAIWHKVWMKRNGDE